MVDISDMHSDMMLRCVPYSRTGSRYLGAHGGSRQVGVLGQQACGCDRWQQEGEVQGRWACKVAAGRWVGTVAAGRWVGTVAAGR